MRHTTLVFHLIFWALYDLAYVIDSKTHVFSPTFDISEMESTLKLTASYNHYLPSSNNNVVIIA